MQEWTLYYRNIVKATSTPYSVFLNDNAKKGMVGALSELDVDCYVMS